MLTSVSCYYDIFSFVLFIINIILFKIYEYFFITLSADSVLGISVINPLINQIVLYSLLLLHVELRGILYS